MPASFLIAFKTFRQGVKESKDFIRRVDDLKLDGERMSGYVYPGYFGICIGSICDQAIVGGRHSRGLTFDSE